MRIVSTSPDATEIVCALGAAGELAGISRFCDFPDHIKDRPRVSDSATVDAESVVKASPDVVLASTRIQDKVVEALVRRNLRVFVLQPTDLSSIFDNVRLVGQLIDRKEEGRDLVLNMKAGLAVVKERGESLPRRPRAMVEEWGGPVMVAVPWVAEILEIAGGENVWPDLVKEADPEPRTVTANDVEGRDPEIDFLAWCGLSGNIDATHAAARSGWSHLRSSRHGGLIPVDDRLLMRGGPRIVEGAARLAGVVEDWVERNPEPTV
ncbi:MAG: ABC transporter substrate-binding protein [Euryarchaeota archaeon]|nr:ABC transporter substrate-binding protein [Euryarchaeota archaeon]